MRVLITGANQQLGQLVTSGLQSDFELRPTAVDLREPESVAPLVAGMDAVLHLANFDTTITDENERLDRASRGTYVLLQEACKAGVQRVVYASRVSLMADYPEGCVVDEQWRPRPRATAESLSPYLGELVCREFARERRLLCVCLRLGESNGPHGVTTDDVRALKLALAMDVNMGDYMWWLYHIAAGGRFVSMTAEGAPLKFK